MNISKTVADAAKVTISDYQEVTCWLSIYLGWTWTAV